MLRSAIKLLVCAAAAIAVFDSVASAAPRIKTKTKYFTVQGSTPGEVLNSILSRGPGGRSGVAMATTQASYSQKVEPRGKKGCRISLSVEITMRLPRLSKSSRSKPVRRAWGSFIRYIRRHEGRHRAIYTGCAKKMDRRVRAAVRKLGCKKSRSRVNAILREENSRCDRLNRAYDRREAKRIRSLPLIRKAKAAPGPGTPAFGGLIFGKHRKKTSKRLRPNRN